MNRPGRIKETPHLKALIKQLISAAECPDNKAKITCFDKQPGLTPATFCHVTSLRQMDRSKKIIGVHVVRGGSNWQHESRIFTKKPAEMLEYLAKNLIIVNSNEAA